MSSIFNQDSLISVFVQNYRNGEESAGIVPSALGSSGFTFICYRTTPEAPLKPRLFVLKFSKTQAALNERTSAIILRNLGLQTPEVHILSSHTAKLVAPISHALKPAFAFDQNRHSLIYMDAYEGGTFSSIVDMKSYKTWTRREWMKIASAFGKVAVFDLLIGNDDRLFTIDKQTGAMTPHFNPGNIMLRKYPREVMDICFIDNATSPSFMPPQSTDDTHFPCELPMLFGEEREESSHDEFISDDTTDFKELWIAMSKKALDNHKAFAKVIMTDLPKIIPEPHLFSNMLELSIQTATQKILQTPLEKILEGLNIADVKPELCKILKEHLSC